MLEPSGRFVGERQHSSSRIASVAAELLAATQHSTARTVRPFAVAAAAAEVASPSLSLARV